MRKSAETYQSYLLRFRRHSVTEPWRITARTIETEEQYHFANLDDLVAFLETQLDIDHSWEVRVKGE